MKRAIITVLGKDKVGITYGVTKILAENNVNILDISQTIMQDMFTMMMIVDIDKISTSFDALSECLEVEGKKLGVDIRIQLESIFESMHRI
ncbi:MAG: ACT domain-containing protein [Ruminococcaceae bacterium]|nr:ACT domain-containing protein [Oscillospiraceae bacterium]